MRAGSWLAGAVLRVFSPVVEKHMGTRVAANVRDAETRLEDIASRPAQIAPRPEGQSRTDHRDWRSDNPPPQTTAERTQLPPRSSEGMPFHSPVQLGFRGLFL